MLKIRSEVLKIINNVKMIKLGKISRKSFPGISLIPGISKIFGIPRIFREFLRCWGMKVQVEMLKSCNRLIEKLSKKPDNDSLNLV